MNIIYIKFNSKEDQVKGYYELAMKHKVLSLPNEVYGVTLPGLQFLEESHISYRRATDEDYPFYSNKQIIFNLVRNLPWGKEVKQAMPILRLYYCGTL